MAQNEPTVEIKKGREKANERFSVFNFEEVELPRVVSKSRMKIL
jgi:hypothetical protein